MILHSRIAARGVQLFECRLQAVDLDRIAQLRSRTVGFDVRYSPRIHTSFLVGLNQ
ncbi:hypothetical protein D3C72_743740 [compost metagenome]